MESLKNFYYRYLRYFLAKNDSTATDYDKYLALAYAVRSHLVDKWIQTQEHYHTTNARRLYYLSMEYMLGKCLSQNIVNLNMEQEVLHIAKELGFDLDLIHNQEDDFELANGAKGRIAGCFLDSFATLSLPVVAYGIRYDYSVFRQRVNNGIQIELPNDWLHKGHPWEIVRPQYSTEIQFKGMSSPAAKPEYHEPHFWQNTESALAVPFDVPIPGYRNNTVNTLRLWAARASEEFLPDYYNHGDYIRACEEKSLSGTVTKVLFPEMRVLRATELRLKQQFFFVSASIQDIIRRYKLHNTSISELDKKVIIHLNGSRCALAIPELQRILVDIEGLPWEDAWNLVQKVFTYTSYAGSRDDLESWPVYMLTELFPRHMEIIYEINQRNLESVQAVQPSLKNELANISLIDEGEVKRVKMAQLALLGSSHINGVSRMHAEQLSSKVFPSMYRQFPERFTHITHGVAHRRWILGANTPLTSLVNDAIGDAWIHQPEKLCELEQFSKSDEFLFQLGDIKHAAKRILAHLLEQTCCFEVDPKALFDVHCCRIQPHKRHMLHLFQIINRYIKLKNGTDLKQNQVHLFGGKASPSDHLGKQIIHCIVLVADTINNDASIENRLKVLFIPDYGMSWAEKIIPAAEVSEQISAPRFDTCGTSAMKLALNGALTLASYTGANKELIDHIGGDNIFPVGMPESHYPSTETYVPAEILSSSEALNTIYSFLETLLNQTANGTAVFPLISQIRDVDDYFILHDFESYRQQHEKIETLFQDKISWLRMSLLNIARTGWFSSDRATSQYAQNIWKVSPA